MIAKLSKFMSINSALEVDLTGQVNSESIGNDYVGTIGGTNPSFAVAVVISEQKKQV